MVHPLVRRLAAIAAVPLLLVALGGCTAIGEVVLDQLGGGQSEGADDEGYVTHDSGNTDLYDVSVGMCIDEADLFGADYFASVDVVDCAQPHYAELYSLFDLAGTEYPGDDEAMELAASGCTERFASYVGTSWEESDFDYWYFYPNVDNWETGDHEVMCLVIDYDYESFTGSARNGEI